MCTLLLHPDLTASSGICHSFSWFHHVQVTKCLCRDALQDFRAPGCVKCRRLGDSSNMDCRHQLQASSVPEISANKGRSICESTGCSCLVVKTCQDHIIEDQHTSSIEEQVGHRFHCTGGMTNITMRVNQSEATNTALTSGIFRVIFAHVMLSR